MPAVSDTISEFVSDIPTNLMTTFLTEPRLGVDLETTGLEWKTEKIATCQIFAPVAGITAIIRITHRPENISQLISSHSVRKIFHHAMFDLRFMHHHWGITSENVVCTKIAAKLLRMRGSENGLKSVLLHFLNVDISKRTAIQLSNWERSALTKTQIRYAVDDVVYLPSLFDRLTLELKKRSLSRLAARCYKHIPTQVDLEIQNYTGIYKY